MSSNLLYFEYTRHSTEKVPVVVFLHGAGGSIQTWKRQREAFQQHFHTVMIDLRDHGQSTELVPHDTPYTLNLISNDILRVLDHLKIDAAYFVTLSMGSFLIQDLMMKRPALVQKCVMAGAVILGTWRIRAFTRLALLFNQLFTYKQMYSIFSKLLMPKKRHEVSRRIYKQQAQKITPEAYHRWLGLYNEFFGMLKRFSDWKINAPTLLIMGEDDYVFLADAKKLSQRQTRVELAVLPQSGHICNIDSPRLFNNIAIEFLARL